VSSHTDVRGLGTVTLLLCLCLYLHLLPLYLTLIEGHVLCRGVGEEVKIVLSVSSLLPLSVMKSFTVCI